ncbi:MAG: hypothetical protein KAR35_02475 [Candidatus Heimdallarchaeota archaeon]|nr:hypothetical protein [Candidatus Heimdallarchaeota archaeon]MCK5048220.1 hypothetical protein [Candidatus Heimdallarchaeota archaeon]
MSSTKPKNISGSTRHSVLLIPQGDSFSLKMKFIVEFYELKRKTDSKEANNFIEAVNHVLEYWDSVTPVGIMDTRFSVWLSDYLSDLKINYPYQEVLALVRGLIGKTIDPSTGTLVDVKALVEEVKVVPSARFLSQVSPPKNVKIKVKHVKLTKLPEFEDDKFQIFTSLLDEHQVLPEKTAKSKIKATGPDGKPIEITKENIIAPSLDPSVPEMTSTITNTYGGPITDLEVVDVIPYSYGVDLFDIGSFDLEPTFNPGDDGLEVKWSIDQLENGSTFEVTYKFQRRINRTILIHQDVHSINIINAYEPITKETDTEFTSTGKYVNDNPSTLSELLIKDHIPKEFIIQNTMPLLEQSKEKIEGEEGTTVLWEFKNVLPNQTLQESYWLEPYPYIIRAKREYTIEGEEKGYTVVKIIKPVYEMNGYDILIYVKGDRNKELVIYDEIPIEFDVVEVTDFSPQPVEEKTADRKKLKFNIPEIEKDLIFDPYYLIESAVAGYRVKAPANIDFYPHQPELQLEGFTLKETQEELEKITIKQKMVFPREFKQFKEN